MPREKSERAIGKISPIHGLAFAVLVLILPAQISSCMRLPREVKAELEPDSTQNNHFAVDQGRQPDSANRAKTGQ